MRAITIPQPGGPEALVLADIAEPVVGPNDVLIEIAAAGVNRADIGQRQGSYPSPPGSPAGPGMEVSGTIVGLGSALVAAAAAAAPADAADNSGRAGSSPADAPASDNSGWAIGDRVCALLGGGGYAERVAVDAGLVLPQPAMTTLVDAAGLPEVAATVWSNVFENGGLREGQTLLVHGGTSGIGTMAIQLGIAVGARVVATAGSAEKVAFCESLGAIGVNYREDDFVAAAKAATDGRGVDVILDLVGGDYLARNIDALATAGTIAVIANQSGSASTFQLGALMGKRGRIWATTLRARPLAEKVAIIAGVREHVWPLIAAGSVRPIIDRVFPLADAADAHRRMEGGDHIGKLLLTP
ncbi:Quinone oxidoreductase 1 [Frondihabitans sp. 762G35]|uniref:NAD(P)H-quinone oxidoreductase n=1 Tax=Frondihabitans sp. 762G35 TaxID=1446794 RepID=UPI000D2209D2|nr:NAD(P)H-quinone oxidoreductase [Frondihabitans sp. 762G35]ARC58278.1 Quinone oxidoreductase 1 [Frondihabitans sp. 762G35]